MDGHLVHTVLHRGKALRRRVTAGVHLLSQLLYQLLQLVELSVAGCKKKKSKISVKSRVESRINQSRTVNGFQQLLALVLPFQLG
jgi:hypothetical protein